MRKRADKKLMKKKSNHMRVLMMKVRWGLVVLIIMLSVSTKAQQHPMYTQYMFNMMNINPAYAGSRGVVTATALVQGPMGGYCGRAKNSFDQCGYAAE
jgi:hypothetical protein